MFPICFALWSAQVEGGWCLPPSSTPRRSLFTYVYIYWWEGGIYNFISPNGKIRKLWKNLNSNFKHRFYFLIFRQSDCRENLHWGCAEKAQEQLMHKKVAVKIWWYSGGARRDMHSSSDQYIFLLLHLNHKCNSRSYHLSSFVNRKWNAACRQADCLLSQGGMVVGSHGSQEHGGLFWEHRPGDMGYVLAPFPLISYHSLPSPAKSYLEGTAEPRVENKR